MNATRMPRKWAREAPAFWGSDIEDFLSDFEALAEAAQLTEEEKCRWLIRYSRGPAEEVINSLPQTRNNDWEGTKTVLLNLYKATDNRKKYTMKTLVNFSHRKRNVSNRSEFDAYHRSFIVIAQSLLRQDLITDKIVNHRFFRGLLPTLRGLVKEELKVTQRWVYTAPPSLERVVSIVRRLLEDDAYQEEYSEGEEEEGESDDGYNSEQSDTDLYPELDPPVLGVRKNKRKSAENIRENRCKEKEATPKVPEVEKGRISTKEYRGKIPSSPPSSIQSDVDSLTEQLKRLEIQLASLTNINQRPSFGPPKSCWMCGQINTHRFGLKNCPETSSLLQTGKIRYTEDGRIIRTNGLEMPNRNIEGGMAKAILKAEKGKGKEPSGSVAHLELMSGGEPVFKFGQSNSVTEATDEANAYEVTKTNKAVKKQRFDPIKRPVKARMKPEIIITIPESKGKAKDEEEVPVALKPSENLAGPSVSQDVEMTNTLKKPKIPKQFKYSTDVQESVKMEDVFEKIMRQPISLTMRDVLGSSITLAKRVQEATKSHRKLVDAEEVLGNREVRRVTFKDSEYDSDDEEEYSVELSEIPKEFRREDSPTVAQQQFVAMASGKVVGHINNFEVEMLLDTGSELNLMSADIQRELNLPMDTSKYRKFQVKGINGSPIGLLGICRETPISIGGVRFDHNFFVTSRDTIGERKVVLGQPFMNYHTMKIEYTPGEGMVAQAWVAGKREGPSIRVVVARVSDNRNLQSAAMECYSSSGAYLNIEVPYKGIIDGKESEITRSKRAEENRIPAVPRVGNLLYESLGLAGTESKLIAPANDLINPEIIKNGGNVEYLRALQQVWDLTGLEPVWEFQNFIHWLLETRGLTATEAGVAAKDIAMAVEAAKYKRVDQKKKPVSIGDPTAPIPQYKEIMINYLEPLPFKPISAENFKYTEKFTPERVQTMIDTIPKGFLRPSEVDLLVYIVGMHQNAFAYSSKERGVFSKEYFPDYVIRTVTHDPWQEKPIRFPLAMEGKIVDLIKERQEGKVYEPSQSAYRSRIFVVEKKDNTYRLVHDLQKLNSKTIKDAGLPPRVDDFAEQFAGHSIYGIADLYSGYDACTLAPESRHLTAFHGFSLGPQQLTCLPQGFTNSVIEFCRRSYHVIKGMADRAGVFVDDIALKGPPTLYEGETIPENPEIRRFVWEYAQSLHELLTRIEISGVTISGKKFVLATPELQLVGRNVSIIGQTISHGTLSKILKWESCQSVSEVRGFLGTVGVVRRWIPDFAKIAKPLTMYTRKGADEDFQWTDEAQDSMDILKEAALGAGALRPLNLELARQVERKENRKSDEGLVTLAVDSAQSGVGWVLFQRMEDGIEYPIEFGSRTFNETESHYSQPKLELYGVFRAVKACRRYLWGYHFRIKVDARSVIQMVNNPDLPNAPMTRWVSYLHLFNFEMEHVPATQHKGPDGLSRRRPSEEDSEESDGEMDQDDAFQYARNINAGWYIYEEQDLVSEEADGEFSEEENYEMNLENSEEEYEGDSEHEYSASDSDEEELDWENEGKWIIQQIAKLDSKEEECLPVEVRWRNPTVISNTGVEPLNWLGRVGYMEGQINPEKQPKSLREHPVDLKKEADFFEPIKKYLTTMELPKGATERRRVLTRVRKFYYGDTRLWRRNGVQPPLLVIEDLEKRWDLCKQVHDETGHRGKLPTYKNLADRVWWPRMFTFVEWYCQTCHECQVRSNYRPKIPIRPTYVRTILKKFALDTVHMPKSRKYNYIVDARDDLSGWLEARMLYDKSSIGIAKFIFEDIMCRFGCIPQIITDNGSEFKDAVQTLVKKYNVPVIHTSAENPRANGMLEVGHRYWLDAIWKNCKGNRNKWSEWFYYAMWADRVTARKATGFSPYYLLYGQAPLFPFDISERTWHTLDWHKVESTTDLLALRMAQLKERDDNIDQASKDLEAQRRKNAQAFWDKYGKPQYKNPIKPGTMVLVYKNFLDNQQGNKGALRWFGPYYVVENRPSGAYVLAELDGTVLSKPIAAQRVKMFYFRENNEPIIHERKPEQEGKWKTIEKWHNAERKHRKEEEEAEITASEESESGYGSGDEDSGGISDENPESLENVMNLRTRRGRFRGENI